MYINSFRKQPLLRYNKNMNRHYGTFFKISALKISVKPLNDFTFQIFANVLNNFRNVLDIGRTLISKGTRFFYKQPFFLILTSVLLNFFMNWVSSIAQVLLTYNHHYNETHFIFGTFVSFLGLGLFLSCLSDLFFIFNLIFMTINHKTLSKQTHLFLSIF